MCIWVIPFLMHSFFPFWLLIRNDIIPLEYSSPGMSFWLVSGPNLIPLDSAGFHRNDRNLAGISGAWLRHLQWFQCKNLDWTWDTALLLKHHTLPYCCLKITYLTGLFYWETHVLAETPNEKTDNLRTPNHPFCVQPPEHVNDPAPVQWLCIQHGPLPLWSLWAPSFPDANASWRIESSAPQGGGAWVHHDSEVAVQHVWWDCCRYKSSKLVMTIVK